MVHLERKRAYLDVYFNDTLILDIVDVSPGIAVWDYHNSCHITVRSNDIDSAYREITPYLDRVINKLLEIDLQKTFDVMRKEIFSREKGKKIDDIISNPPYNDQFKVRTLFSSLYVSNRVLFFFIYTFRYI